MFDDSMIEILSTIVVPDKFFNRIKLGVQVLDELFGGPDMPGILPGSSFLFSGSPGAGKSTMCLHIADMMQIAAGRSVLYNVGEENKFMIKMRADRIKVKGDFCISDIDNVDELIKFCRETGVEVLFQDSIQTMTDGELFGPAKLKSVVKKFHEFSKKDDIIVFMVGHVTKADNFAGPQELAHTVDVNVHLGINKETGNRVLELLKNRFGPATIPYEFVMSASGIDFKQIVVIESGGTGTGGKAAERRENTLTLIKKKLLVGDKISGYDFEKYGVDCSGGFWRGMLAKACSEMQKEGMIIKECKIDGRTHFFIEVPL